MEEISTILFIPEFEEVSDNDKLLAPQEITSRWPIILRSPAELDSQMENVENVVLLVDVIHTNEAAPINLPTETNEADGMNPDNNIEVTNIIEALNLRKSQRTHKSVISSEYLCYLQKTEYMR